MPQEVGLIENTSLWWREVNIPGPMKLLEVENTSMGEFTIAGVPAVTPTFNRNAEGKFVKLFESTAAPGDLSSTSILYRVWLSRRHPLYNLLIQQQKEIYVQRLWYSCPPTDDRVLWKHLEHYRLRSTGGTKAASTDLVGSAGSQNNTLNISVLEDIESFRASLARITISEVLAINCIAGMSKDNDCLPGYPGRDRLLFIGAAASGAPANALYSTNGGGTFAAFTTDPTPFTVNSSITAAAVDFISETQIRVFWLRAGDIGTKAQLAYQDFPFNGTTLTAASWNLITIAASANNDDGEALLWYKREGRLYIAVEGDIYISLTDGTTDPGAKVLTGTDAIAMMIEHNGDIWVAAANNVIRVERLTLRGTFAARTGPSGGGAFTALAFADDGKLFAGNGTALYKSVDEAGSDTGWTSLKDFGSNHVIKSIRCKGGSSEILEVEVDDTTPGPGEVWFSEDGGSTWRQLTESANGGYNGVYYPADLDQALIVGDAVSSLGWVELLS